MNTTRFGLKLGLKHNWFDQIATAIPTNFIRFNWIENHSDICLEFESFVDPTVSTYVLNCSLISRNCWDQFVLRFASDQKCEPRKTIQNDNTEAKQLPEFKSKSLTIFVYNSSDKFNAIEILYSRYMLKLFLKSDVWSAGLWIKYDTNPE